MASFLPGNKVSLQKTGFREGEILAESNYSIPLSKISKLQDPFDASEQGFINKFRNDSLILIEDAGEVVKDLIHEKLIDMLGLISQGREYEIITANYFHDDDITINGLEGFRRIKFDPKKSKDPKCFGLIELNLDGGTSGGHFCGFIRDGEKVWIYDPMTFGPKKDNDGGVYFKIFRQVAMWAFNIEERNVKKVVVANDKDGCLQLTGGFANTCTDPESYEHNENSEFHLQRYKEYMEHYPREVVSYMIEYGPDSQNHFCYVWSIYWLHCVFGTEIQGVNTYGIQPEALADFIKSCDLIPVSYIRLYTLQWIEYYKADLINTVRCDNKGGNFRYPRGYLYGFVKRNFPKTLYWKKINDVKRSFSDSPYTISTGLIFINGQTMQIQRDQKILFPPRAQPQGQGATSLLARVACALPGTSSSSSSP